MHINPMYFSKNAKKNPRSVGRLKIAFFVKRNCRYTTHRLKVYFDHFYTTNTQFQISRRFD